MTGCCWGYGLTRVEACTERAVISRVGIVNAKSKSIGTKMKPYASAFTAVSAY